MSYFNKLLAVKEAIDVSKLYNEKTFYKAFIKDLERVRNEVIIESPFITIERVKYFIPIFTKLIKKGVQIHVYTRIAEEQSDEMQYQTEKGIDLLEEIGVFVVPVNCFLHRKLAIIDNNIVWEGSLNILSQRNSQEFMQRLNNQSEVIKIV